MSALLSRHLVRGSDSFLLRLRGGREAVEKKQGGAVEGGAGGRRRTTRQQKHRSGVSRKNSELETIRRAENAQVVSNDSP